MIDKAPLSNRLKGAGIEPAGESVRFTFDGAHIEAVAGETIAAALTAAAKLGLRRTRGGALRGVFCGMGICYECLVTVDGVENVRACLTPVAEGMIIETGGHTGD